MEPFTILPFLIIITGASVLQGITGFGYAVVSAPLLFLILPKESVISTYAILSVVLNGTLFQSNGKHPPYKKLLPFIFFSFLGLPFGAFLLTVTDQIFLTKTVGLLTILLIPFILWRDKIRLPRSQSAAALTGFLVGTLQTSTGVNGPVTVAYLFNIMRDHNSMRKALAIIFFLLALGSLPVLVISGSLRTEGLFLGALGVLPVIAGAKLGNRLAGTVPLPVATAITTGIILLNGISVLIY